MDADRLVKGPLSLLAGAILTGSISIFVRFSGLGTVENVFFRAFLGAVVLAFVIKGLGRSLISLKSPKLLLAFCILNISMVFSYFVAIEKLSAGTAALLLYTQPLYSIPLAYLFLKEKINKVTFLSIPLSLVGLFLLVSAYNFQSNAGLLFGLLSGLLFALMIIVLKKLRQDMSSLKINFLNWAFASILLSPVLLGLDVSKINILAVLGLGIIPTAIGVTLFNRGLKYCQIQYTAVISLTEPIAAAVFGFFVFSETLTLVQLFGATLILASIAVSALKNYT